MQGGVWQLGWDDLDARAGLPSRPPSPDAQASPPRPHPRAAAQGLTTWLAQHGVVQQVLKSNLHQAQYADQAQRVLSTLLQHGALSDDAIAFLWQLAEGARGLGAGAARAAGAATMHACRLRCMALPIGRRPALPALALPLSCVPADATTFEAVKSNAYAILANLGPHMDDAQRAQLFARLRERAAASGVSEATAILRLLVGMAQRDRKASRAGKWARRWGGVGSSMRRLGPPSAPTAAARLTLCLFAPAGRALQRRADLPASHPAAPQGAARGRLVPGRSAPWGHLPRCRLSAVPRRPAHSSNNS